MPGSAKAPTSVLPTQELKDAWIGEGTDIIEQATKGRVKRANIYASVSYAVDGAWGIGGTATATAILDRRWPQISQLRSRADFLT